MLTGPTVPTMVCVHERATGAAPFVPLSAVWSSMASATPTSADQVRQVQERLLGRAEADREGDGVNASQIQNRAEREFALSLDKAGKTWFYHGTQFDLPSGNGRPLRYQPDFYVIEDGCFYEVVGTRQAYSYQRQSIAAFRAAYPQFPLRVVNVGAWIRGPVQKRVEIPKRPHRSMAESLGLRRARARAQTAVHHAILSVADLEGDRTLAAIARRLGVTMSRLRSLFYVTSPTPPDILMALAEWRRKVAS